MMQQKRNDKADIRYKRQQFQCVYTVWFRAVKKWGSPRESFAMSIMFIIMIPLWLVASLLGAPTPELWGGIPGLIAMVGVMLLSNKSRCWSQSLRRRLAAYSPADATAYEQMLRECAEVQHHDMELTIVGEWLKHEGRCIDRNT
ncbi:MAG: hypothetical protein RSD49_02485 [Hafnia sp.]